MCNNGHLLCRITKSGYSEEYMGYCKCDLCGENYLVGDEHPAYNCHECQYDLCECCYGKFEQVLEKRAQIVADATVVGEEEEVAAVDAVEVEVETPVFKKYGKAVEKKNIVFRTGYRDANPVSRLLYSWFWRMISSLKQNNNVMTEEMLEDMRLSEDETEKYLGHFQSRLDEGDKALTQQEQRGIISPAQRKEKFYYIVRNAVWSTFGKDFMIGAVFCFCGEVCAIGFTAYLAVLVNFLKRDNTTSLEACQQVVIFGMLMFGSVFCRNYYTFFGYTNSVRIRKILIASLFNKISKLSMKSLTSTNSGKLITIVNGDIK